MNRADMAAMAFPRLQGLFAAGPALAISGLVLCACAKPAPPAEGPPPKSLAGADPIIIAVQPTPRGVRVIARVAEPDLAGGAIRAAAAAVRQLARAVQARAADLPPGAEVITFDLYGVDVDKFGKRTPGRLFESDFDVGDLRGADLAQKGPAGVLNLAVDLRIDKAGIDPINAWCMRYPHAAGNYCTMAGD